VGSSPRLGRGWNASISIDSGHILPSPWYTKPVSKQHLTLSRDARPPPLPAKYRAASFATALHYLSNYCKLHKVAEQSHTALAATLLLPVARFINRKAQLPTPRVCIKVEFRKKTICKPPIWSKDLDQLGRLLTKLQRNRNQSTSKQRFLQAWCGV
jgi:hypothetical protein